MRNRKGKYRCTREGTKFSKSHSSRLVNLNYQVQHRQRHWTGLMKREQQVKNTRTHRVVILTFVRLCLEQLLNAWPGAPLRRRPTQAVRGRGVGPLGQQQRDYLHVAATARIVKGGVPVFVASIGVGAPVEKQPNAMPHIDGQQTDRMMI